MIITDESRPWLNLASRAFAAQARGDDDLASRLVQRIAVEHDAVVSAMVAWIDTLLVHGFGVTEFNENGAAVVFGAAGDDRYRFADGSQPPEVVWSGRMFAARAAGDEAMWGALLDAVTGEDATDASWTRHVLTLLSCAALTFNAVTAGAS